MASIATKSVGVRECHRCRAIRLNYGTYCFEYMPDDIIEKVKLSYFAMKYHLPSEVSTNISQMLLQMCKPVVSFSDTIFIHPRLPSCSTCKRWIPAYCLFVLEEGCEDLI
jgi:hypothetical protein